MRFVFVLALMLPTCGLLHAQETESPQESYENFVDAVLDKDLTDDDRTARFERYFDFNAWVTRQERELGEGYAPEERRQLREDWLELFRSDEFRDMYETSNVSVEKELLRDDETGKAELLIAMENDDGTQKFRVLMNRSEDGTYWRWYAIPQFMEDEPEPEELTPAERLAEIEEQLKAIAERRRELEAIAEQLRREAGKIRAEIAEQDAGESPYATPQSVVETAWQAIEDGDADALIECHTFDAQAQEDYESGALSDKIRDLKQRLMTWEVLDTTVDDSNPNRATVRVKLTMQRTGDADERTISVEVVKIGEEWKIDEVP